MSVLAGITLQDSLQHYNYAGLPDVGRTTSAELLDDTSAVFAVVLPSSIAVIILPPIGSNGRTLEM